MSALQSVWARSRSASLTVSIERSIAPERANWWTIAWATMFGEM